MVFCYNHYVMINTFALLLPVFGIITAGYLLCRYNIVRPDWIKLLNHFIYYISLPALILSLFWKIELTGENLSFFGFHVGLIVLLSLILIVSLSVFSIDRKTKVAIVLGALMGNTMYMGYPILRSTFPNFPIEVSMGAGTVQLITSLLIGVFLVEYLIYKTKNFSTYFIDLAKNPLIIAVVIGIALSFFPHNQNSEAVFNLISIIGETASPLALFTLGVFMYRKFSKHSWLLGGFAITAKLVILPLVVFLISVLFGYSKEFTQVSVLISAMPTAITSFVLAQKYSLNEQLTADIILVSTLLSILSLPVAVWLVS